MPVINESGMTPEQFRELAAKIGSRNDVSEALGVSAVQCYRYETGKVPISVPIAKLLSLMAERAQPQPTS